VATVVVSAYPPRHCGVGAYAAAQVARLREEGEEVVVISPPDGDGDVRVRFWSGRPFRVALKASSAEDRVVVHFQPALYYRPRRPLAKIAASWRLLRLCRQRPHTEIVVHEADPPRRWRPDYVLLARAFREAPALVFHTEAERRALEESYRVGVRGRVVPHTDGIRVAAPTTRAEARRRLEIREDQPLLVAPGFLHPDKGYERAVDAFARAGRGRLVIVGGVRDETPRNLSYARSLRERVAVTPGVSMIEGFLPDAEFDDWLVAADAVVLPYRRSWSSGALARAQVLGTPAIVTDVGGLAEQASERDVVVRDDRELVAAVASVCGRRVRGEVG
jgi:glycosyltransferase involved in cell wall biosynthesis